MSTMLNALALGVLPYALAANAAPATVHVAPTGNDTAAGTAAAPFATLERARQAVREKQATDVVIHGGVYERGTTFALTAEDSGTPEAPVVWRAAEGEQVRLVGGRTVPGDALKTVTAPDVLARLDPAARGKVVEADLGALGITALGDYPAKFRGAPAVPELFIDDQRMQLARWPNEGWATVAQIVDQGDVPRNSDHATKPGSFLYDGDRPARWNVDKGVWLLGYWCFDWYEEAIRVASIDPATKLITFAAPALYGVRQGNPSPRRFVALNLLEELDQPGEYYLDREAKKVYLWPPAEGAKRIVLSTLDAPILSLTDCTDVVVRGLTVEAGLGVGIAVNGGARVSVEACDVRNLRQRGIEVQGGTAHQVLACDIHDTGTGGLMLSGGDRKTLTPAGHEAVNNHIWRFSEHQLTYASGLVLAGVGNRAAHNLLHDAPHMAVGISGNDHLFELNVVRDCCTSTDDAGALYKGRDPSMRGNVIRHNFFHHIGSPMGHGNAAVYFDDGDGGETVEGNVFYQCGEPGKGNFGTIFCHGGHDNRADNNIFIACRRAIGSSPWNDKRWADMVHAALWQERLLKTVDITSPVYTEHYPALVGFMDPQPGQVRVNRAARNVFVMCGQVSSGNWQWQPEENLVTDTDPGFVDLAGGDFTLRPDSEVFTKVPGFAAIPFDQMGLVADELRPKPPVETWAYPPAEQVAPPEHR